MNFEIKTSPLTVFDLHPSIPFRLDEIIIDALKSIHMDRVRLGAPVTYCNFISLWTFDDEERENPPIDELPYPQHPGIEPELRHE